MLDHTQNSTWPRWIFFLNKCKPCKKKKRKLQINGIFLGLRGTALSLRRKWLESGNNLIILVQQHSSVKNCSIKPKWIQRVWIQTTTAAIFKIDAFSADAQLWAEFNRLNTNMRVEIWTGREIKAMVCDIINCAAGFVKTGFNVS